MAGLYIHVPFCLKRCLYCDFYSGIDIKYKETFLSALLHEMELRSKKARGEKIETIYFGGGTPSLLEGSVFHRLFEAIYHHFSCSETPEITLEANPDDLSPEYINALRALPFNRISIGIQSFINAELELLGRRHSAEEAIRAVKHCQKAGFKNINIDLMYGLPEQTIDQWKYNIKEALKLDIQHISAYSLTYEEGSALCKMKASGEIQAIGDDVSAHLFKILTDTLAHNGFSHYEVSNFARRTDDYPEGMVSLHNSSYWDGSHYIGLGPSAHSYDGKTRSWNISSLTEYIYSITEKKKRPYEQEILDERTRYNDFIITRLRTNRGLSIAELEESFGEERKRFFLDTAAPFIDSEMLKKEGLNVKISPENFFLSDTAIRGLIVLQGGFGDKT